jgi:hemerythrin-like domain-containing protein
MSHTIPLSSLTSTKSSSFEEPFEMLQACHERVHRMLDLLERLRSHLRTRGGDEQAQQAARDVMRYFDQAAPRHHEDEERHVFPPLLAQGDPATVAVVQRLQADHVRMEAAWADARKVLDAVAQGWLDELQVHDEDALARFAGLYGDHIVAEETIVYPAAARVIDAAGQSAMGREMAQRRGVG